MALADAQILIATSIVRLSRPGPAKMVALYRERVATTNSASHRKRPKGIETSRIALVCLELTRSIRL